MSGTETSSIGRPAGTRLASRRSWSTEAPDLDAPLATVARLTQTVIASCCSTSGCVGEADLSPMTHLWIFTPTPPITSSRTWKKLREHLEIERWLLWGVSWGSTLLLAYAERYPERVSEIVITGVSTTRRSEIDWLYRGLYRFFPEEWVRFRAAAGDPPDDSLIIAYSRLMADPDPHVRAQAAQDWSAWEDATISLDPDGNPGAYSDRPPELLLARARICAHYFAHAAWLEEGELLINAGRLAGIPGVLIHGRIDMGGLDTAWELATAWQGSELVVVDRSGHSGSAEMTSCQVTALNEFAAP